MVDAAILDAYEVNVPVDSKESAKRLDAIDRELMEGALADRMAPMGRLQQLLLEVTALHSFFANRYWKWQAILDNQEAEEYMNIKREIDRLGGTTKFVSAAAEREAASKVSDVRYVVNYYKAQLIRCAGEQGNGGYVNTIKKLFDTLQASDKTA